ncbi:MAG: zinc-binding dehydrogenase, partial [Actinomycetota bacterium]|nr:zinc-binding dehydrogenase [Actinomycetota bacterium]
ADLVGRRVVAGPGGTGGYAERAVVDASRLIALDDGMPMREAVALLSDGRTAVGLIRLASLSPGETAVVEAAAGDVGTLLVQLARTAGARVIALVGGARKLAVDVVFDGVGGAVGLAASVLLGPGGRFLPFGMASGSFASGMDGTVPADPSSAENFTVLRSARSTPDELVALTRAALREAELGRLRPVIGQEFALEDAAAAHAAIEGRETVGKTLLVVGHPPASPGGESLTQA